jgi:hypothetical protein
MATPFFVLKKSEKTLTSEGPIFFKGLNIKKPAAEAIAEFMKNFVYFDPTSNTESGLATDFIRVALPGTLYTWIIKRTASGKYVLIAARTRGAQEIGTLHANLNAFTEGTIPGKVIAAGEMIRTKSGIIYNFFSGSFMEPLFRVNAAVTKATERAAASSAAEEVFNVLFPGAALPTASQLIIPAALPPTSNKNRNVYDKYLNRNVPKTEARTNGSNGDPVARVLFGGARRRRTRKHYRRRKHTHKKLIGR